MISIVYNIKRRISLHSSNVARSPCEVSYRSLFRCGLFGLVRPPSGRFRVSSSRPFRSGLPGFGPAPFWTSWEVQPPFRFLSCSVPDFCGLVRFPSGRFWVSSSLPFRSGLAGFRPVPFWTSWDVQPPFQCVLHHNRNSQGGLACECTCSQAARIKKTR